MKKVFKYQLDYIRTNTGAVWTAKQIIKLPIDSQILKIDIQNGNLVLWALVDVDTIGTVDIELFIAGTGHDIEEKFNKYINTFYDGSLVMHVFTIAK